MFDEVACTGSCGPLPPSQPHEAKTATINSLSGNSNCPSEGKAASSPQRRASPVRVMRRDRLDTTSSAPEAMRAREGRRPSEDGRGYFTRFPSMDVDGPDLSRRRPSTDSSRISWFHKDRLLYGFKAWKSEKVFPDADAMKDKVRQTIVDSAPTVRDLYKHQGVCQQIVRKPCFEWMALLVIAANAVWIAVDADYNEAVTLLDAIWYFQIIEHAFCSFFLIEWILRFSALQSKVDAVQDRWFLFDSFLALMSVVETWILTIVMSAIDYNHNNTLKSANLLRLTRIFRLMRLSRMVRLMRALPELIFMIRGMLAATRSVMTTMVLLFCILYCFGVAFRQLADGTEMGEEFFGTVVQSMYTLLIAGTLLDNVTVTVSAIGRESMTCAVLFFVVILLAALTVMNMLIGVTCEVVSTVARTEKERAAVTFVKERMWYTLWQTQVSDLDADNDGVISKEEFRRLIESPEAFKALRDVGVDVMAMVDLAELIFQSDQQGKEYERKLNFHEFMDVVLQLRGNNSATVKDIVDLRRFLHLENTTRNNTLARMEERQRMVESRINSIEHKLDKLLKHWDAREKWAKVDVDRLKWRPESEPRRSVGHQQSEPVRRGRAMSPAGGQLAKHAVRSLSHDQREKLVQRAKSPDPPEAWRTPEIEEEEEVEEQPARASSSTKAWRTPEIEEEEKVEERPARASSSTKAWRTPEIEEEEKVEERPARASSSTKAEATEEPQMSPMSSMDVQARRLSNLTEKNQSGTESTNISQAPRSELQEEMRSSCASGMGYMQAPLGMVAEDPSALQAAAEEPPHVEHDPSSNLPLGAGRRLSVLS